MFCSWLSALPQSSCTIWQTLLVVAGNAVCSRVWSRAANGCHPFLRYYCSSWVLPFPIWWWRDLLSVADVKSEGSHPSFRTQVCDLVETVGKLFLHLEFSRKLVLLTLFIWRGTIKWLISLTAPGARGCLLSQQAILEHEYCPLPKLLICVIAQKSQNHHDAIFNAEMPKFVSLPSLPNIYFL